jgi:sphinganine-1-phosphate aldolase
MKRVNHGDEKSSVFYTDTGKLSGCLFLADDKHWNFVADVMRKYIVTNPLHMDEFKSVTQMEAEIIRWMANLYNGDQNSCGLISSSGTESILLACLAYRE